MVLTEPNWMIREYNHQMSVRPSNISFEDWADAKGYIKKENKKKDYGRQRETSEEHRKGLSRGIESHVRPRERYHGGKKLLSRFVFGKRYV